MQSVRSIVDVPGISVGHATNLDAITGCTVVLCPEGATAAVDVRGGAPGTRETDLLGTGRLVQNVHAILLTGGSAMGLAAADGVVQFLLDRGFGFPVGRTRVPIVPAAVLYDLTIGDMRVFPDARDGWQACERARADDLEEGCVGAGTGATVGKVLGPAQATKSGLGSAALRLPSGITVGALVAVNAFGEVVNPVTGQILAGARHPTTGEYVSAVSRLLGGELPSEPMLGASTTIGVVATDASLDRDALQRVATAAHDGLARAVRPAHTLFDGDTFFALATGRSAAAVSPVAIAVAASEVVATAIIRAVMQARPMGGLPGPLHRETTQSDAGGEPSPPAA
ncbi:MAG TPA: P1 family peptidase [Chloroflexota bacterium]|nr:P1 family peptidase [Chloroflexota bacterium]